MGSLKNYYNHYVKGFTDRALTESHKNFVKHILLNLLLHTSVYRWKTEALELWNDFLAIIVRKVA